MKKLIISILLFGACMPPSTRESSVIEDVDEPLARCFSHDCKPLDRTQGDGFCFRACGGTCQPYDLADYSFCNECYYEPYTPGCAGECDLNTGIPNFWMHCQPGSTV